MASSSDAVDDSALTAYQLGVVRWAKAICGGECSDLVDNLGYVFVRVQAAAVLLLNVRPSYVQNLHVRAVADTMMATVLH